MVDKVVSPVLLVVDDEAAALAMLGRELRARYGSQYRVVGCSSAEDALAGLAGLRAEAADVPLVLADQWMTGTTGVELLARVRDLYPTARRGLLVSWGDRSTSAPILAAAASGQIDFYVAKPAWFPDEQFHLAITESLAEWWRQRGGQFEAVTVIGDELHPRSHEIRDLLTRNSVPFGFHRSDSARGRELLDRLDVPANDGPAVAMYSGAVLVDPSNAEVGAALGLDVRPTELDHDVVIIGGGPAGLAAAVYAASEGLRTVVLEREAFGGQAGTSSLIRNYPGFPRGISGAELAWRAYQQAWVFGTRFVYGNPAMSLSTGDRGHLIGLADGSSLRSRAVIVATGVSYRHLDIPGLEPLVGAGVFYGAATVAVHAVTGRHAFVVGGGNSAGQAAMHLSRYAKQVSVLVRSASLAASMSDYLIREIGNAPNIDVRYGVDVVGVAGDGRLEQVRLRDHATGATEALPAAGLFVLIGARPYTDWLPDTIHRDDWGYLLTGPDAGRHWPLRRPPLLMETSRPGVFAVGDARHGSIKRVASAVGEGSICVRLIHEYLAGA